MPTGRSAALLATSLVIVASALGGCASTSASTPAGMATPDQTSPVPSATAAATEQPVASPAPATQAGQAESWAGITFPGEVDGYRLIGSAEFTSFRASGDDCGRLTHSLGTSQATGISAFYTKQTTALTPGDCDFSTEAMTVLYRAGQGAGYWFSSAPDANGNQCVQEEPNSCAYQSDGGWWLVNAFNGDATVDEVSSFLTGIVTGATVTSE